MTLRPLALPGIVAGAFLAASGAHPWWEFVALVVGYSFGFTIKRR